MRGILCLFICFLVFTPALADDTFICVKGQGRDIHARITACDRIIASNTFSAEHRALLHNFRANLLFQIGRHQKAIADYQQAQILIKKADMRGKELGRKRLLIMTSIGMAHAYHKLGQLQEADTQAWLALAQAKRIRDNNLIVQASAIGVVIQQEKARLRAASRYNRNDQNVVQDVPRKRQQVVQLPIHTQTRNVTGSITQPSSGTSYMYIIAAILAFSGLSFVAFRFGFPLLRSQYIDSNQSDFTTHEYSETIMSQTKSAVLEAFAPTETKDRIQPVQKVGGMQPMFDVSNMQLHLRREQKRNMSGSVTYTLHLFVEMGDDAKNAIKHYGFGNEIIYTKKPVMQADSLWAKLNPWKWVMHIIWWLLTRRLHSVRVKELVTGKTLKCKDIFEMVEIENQIFHAMKNFGRIMYTAAHFGGEEIFNIDHEIGVTQAQAA